MAKTDTKRIMLQKQESAWGGREWKRRFWSAC